MTPLPIDAVIPRIVESLRRERSLVLVAPPGSGKTTRVPPAILRAGILSAENPVIIMLQLRRVAARAAAQRIADENGWGLGVEVGFQIRFERRVGPRTRLVVETEGILNRQLLSDPFLEGVGCVILDEFHERSIHTDLAIALLREVRETVREDLRIVVMSATLDAGPVSRFLGGCPVIEAEGRTFPVEVVYRPVARPSASESVVGAVEEVVRDTGDSGHILVFLPGVEEIRRAGAGLAGVARREGLEVLPLHGSLSGDEQDRIFRLGGGRKVILATNIAETSLTIDGVTTVIDSGLARFASDDPVRGVDRLELGRISKASAAQRGGRAGRTGPGRCVRLWSEWEERGMAEYDTPEVARVDLASTLLALHSWGVAEPSKFGWFETPPVERLESAERLLESLGALGGEERRLTPLGRQLLAIPAHPRMARLLTAASEAGYPQEGAALAALLTEKDIVGRQMSGEAKRGGSERGLSDLFNRLDLLAEAEGRKFSGLLRDRGIDPLAARQVSRARDEFARIARRLHGSGAGDEPDEAMMLRWVLMAYPDRVVKRRGSEATGVMTGGRGVRLSAESVVRDHEFYLALDPREDRRGGTLEAKVRMASALRVEWLEELFPGSMRNERSVEFDEERSRPVGVTRLWYRDLLLREDRNAKVDLLEAADALAVAIRLRAVEFLRENDEGSGWLARLEFLRGAMPEGGWPDFDIEAIGEVVSVACVGKRTLEEVRKTPLVPILRSRLTHAQSRAMDDLAPEGLVVPSGNRIRLSYQAGGPPILAVRLQELFGWTETPRLAGGRVPVLVHLLGPNYRPVQVTDDLQSFWATAYFQVRKDLRARYPRHAWPDDPLTARAEAKGSRRP